MNKWIKSGLLGGLWMFLTVEIIAGYFIYEQLQLIWWKLPLWMVGMICFDYFRHKGWAGLK